MKLSTKSHCAITAMIQMALSQNEGPISLLNLSKCQTVSLSYLEQILAQLRQQGLVKGMRGPGGGYMLAREPAEIHVAEVVAAVGDMTAGRWSQPIVPDAYIGVSDEARGHWNALSDRLFDLLSQLKLSDLVDKRHSKDQLWQQQLDKTNIKIDALDAA